MNKLISISVFCLILVSSANAQSPQPPELSWEWKNLPGAFNKKAVKIKLTREEAFMRTYKVSFDKMVELRSWVDKASSASNVPRNVILAVMATESSLNHSSKGTITTSHKNAIGLMQIVPAIWADSFKNMFDLEDSEENIMAGATILKKYWLALKDKNRKCYLTWNCAIEAYNVGITAYKKGERTISAKEYMVAVGKNLNKL